MSNTNKTIVIVFAVFAVCILAGVIVGVTTHTEPGFMATGHAWDVQDFPLTVCAKTWRADEIAHLDTDDAETLHYTINTINTRMGRALFQTQRDTNACNVEVTFKYPVSTATYSDELRQAGGDMVLQQGVCVVRTGNVTGNLRAYTLQHELGHCLGLDHDQSEISIMRPVQSDTFAQISDSDRSLLLSTYFQ